MLAGAICSDATSKLKSKLVLDVVFAPTTALKSTVASVATKNMHAMIERHMSYFGHMPHASGRGMLWNGARASFRTTAAADQCLS